MGGRFAVLIGVFLLAYGVLVFKLYDLQITHGAYYQARAASKELAASFLEAKRGTVYFVDKNGDRVAVAINKGFPIVYAVPRDVKKPELTASILAPLLGDEQGAILKKLSKSGDQYELLGEKVPAEKAAEIDALKIEGIYVATEPRRFYPFDSMASNLLGFVGPTSEGAGRAGHYGIEEFYEKKLAGISGGLVENKYRSPTAGEDVVLTLDPNIQLQAERVLDGLVKTYEAKGGSIIVQEPESGKILALTSRPNFDPNSYHTSGLENFLNPTTQGIYEPGSVFKVFTLVGALDSGKITPETTFNDTGTLTMNGRKISNYDYETHGPRGKSTMSNILEYSMNTGAVFVERRMGRDLFKNYVQKFGFGEKTGIGLLGEVAGDVRRLSPKEKDIAFATAAYGQGIAITPLELINAVSAVANGGTLMRPYVDASLSPSVIRSVVSKDATKKVTEMMVSAVTKAKVAEISGYAIAGKTGTANVPDFKNGGYTDDVINTYVGFAPAANPRFSVLIKLDEPLGKQLAGVTVVPAFREIAEFALNYYNVPPDRLETATGL